MYEPHFFFTKLKPKIEGAPYPLILLCLEFSKTWFLFIKLLNVPRNKHKRNWERVAVVHWLFHWVVAPKGAVCVLDCLSANLALQEFFQAINFRFTRTTKHQHTRNLLSSVQLFAVTSVASHFHAYLSAMWDKVPPVLHEVLRLLQVSKHFYTRGIPEQLSHIGTAMMHTIMLFIVYLALVCVFF